MFVRMPDANVRVPPVVLREEIEKHGIMPSLVTAVHTWLRPNEHLCGQMYSI